MKKLIILLFFGLIAHIYSMHRVLEPEDCRYMQELVGQALKDKKSINYKLVRNDFRIPIRFLFKAHNNINDALVLSLLKPKAFQEDPFYAPLKFIQCGGDPNAAALRIFRKYDLDRKKKNFLTDFLYDNGADPEEVNQLNAYIIQTFNDLDETLLRASEYGRFNYVRTLVNANADINVPDENKHTPLLLAVRFQHPEIARFLLAHDAEVNVQDNNASTPLLWATFVGDINIMRMLLTHNADIQAMNDTGTNALILSVIKGHPREIAQLLLEHGININAQDALGRTALMWAVFTRNEDLIEFLLEQGADITLTDETGATALVIARSKHHPGIIALLEKAQVEYEQAKREREAKQIEEEVEEYDE